MADNPQPIRIAPGAPGGRNSYHLTPEEKAEVEKKNRASGKQHLVDERNTYGADHSEPIREGMKRGRKPRNET